MSEKAILNVDAVMVDRDEDRSHALHGSHTMKRFVDFREYPRKALRTVSTHEDHRLAIIHLLLLQVQLLLLLLKLQ